MDNEFSWVSLLLVVGRGCSQELPRTGQYSEMSVELFKKKGLKEVFPWVQASVLQRNNLRQEKIP